MLDTVEVISKGCIIQHGKHNDRVYLMKANERGSESLVSELFALSEKYNYSKIICKVQRNLAPLFFANGFIMEATIPKFYNQNDDVFFVSKFLDSDRSSNVEKEQLSTLSNLLCDKPNKKSDHKKQVAAYTLRKLTEPDVEQITNIYREVFETYPFPIHDPEYILKTMQQDVQYFGAEKDGKLAALSSAEIDFKGKNAEMTDFATRPEHAGNNLSVLLLEEMEKEMKKQDVNTLYTIARLNSIPMNKTFLRSQYEYSGTLIKNTNIAGKIESMNVYYKHL